jgi:hypothetical protein
VLFSPADQEADWKQGGIEGIVRWLSWVARSGSVASFEAVRSVAHT